MAKLIEKTREIPRPPVVAILGHIDHGKSTLIDYIRKTNVVSGEAGGITQHASAYAFEHTSKEGKSTTITILDTPGHEAFENIRARCASVADIAVLIVSAEDGVKPQTLEVLKCIQSTKIPFVVAITKIDKPTADVEKAKQSLAESGIFVEGYGGEVPVVPLSAKTGAGVDELLDMITLMADLEGVKADTSALGSGVIIESRMDAKRGITAVGIIKNGKVSKGLFAASPGAVTPLRFLLDFDGKMVEELSFSSPVQIVGWDSMPTVGEEFRTFLKKDEAIEFSKEKKTVQNKSADKSSEDISTLPIVVKTDTAGSLEAIKGEFNKIARERIKPRIILSGIGSINENDVKAALTTAGTIVVGFHTKVDAQAGSLAERSGIPVLTYEIIYELTDKVKELLQEKEPRIEVEEITSSIKVLKIFNTEKNNQVLGGRVLSGILNKGNQLRILRREAEIGRAKVKGLQHAKVDTDSVSEGMEFGGMIESKIEIAPGDVLNAVTLVTK